MISHHQPRPRPRREAPARRRALTVHAGHKVGLIGPNGSGKSSLFALIRGELHQDAGDVELPPAWTIAHVAQETPAIAVPAIDFVLDGDRELREVERELAATEAAATTESDGNGERLALLHHRFDEIGGYAARARAATLLSPGWASPPRGTTIRSRSFSGGWRMRLNLAQALMCRSDLLLLDEPTNHLDLDAVLWLEDWLARYPGTLLLITHDRDFLDAVVTHDRPRRRAEAAGPTPATTRSSSASAAQQLALQQASYAKQQRQIAHLQAFVDRFRAKATKAKQAQSRIKALERMERIAAAHVDSPFEFAFAPVADRRAAARAPRTRHARLRRSAADPRATSTGRSSPATGSGCSGPTAPANRRCSRRSPERSLPRTGERHIAQALKIGYFAQHQVEQLRATESPLWHVAKATPARASRSCAIFSAASTFRGDMVTAPVGPLLRRREGAPHARAARAAAAQPADPRRADQSPRHRDARGARRSAAGLRRRARRRRARPPPAARDDRCAVARRRRRGRAVRRRSRRLPRVGALLAAAAGRSPANPARRPTARRRSAPRPSRASATTRSASRSPTSSTKLERELSALGAEKTALEAWLASPDAYTEAGKDDTGGKARSPGRSQRGSSHGSRRSGSRSRTPSSALTPELSRRRTAQPMRSPGR